MTIDAIIARLIFDAVDKDEEFQAKTEKLIDILATYKFNRTNSISDFLFDRIEQQAYFCGSLNNSQEYENFLADLAYPHLLPFVERGMELNQKKEVLKNDYFLVDFLNKHDFDDEMYSLAKRDYINQVKKTASSIDSYENLFKDNYALRITTIINSIENPTCQQLIFLANTRRLLALNTNSSIAAAYKSKVTALGLKDEFIDAYDYILIHERAKQLKAEESKMYPLTKVGNLAIDRLLDLQNSVRLELLKDYYKSISPDGNTIDLNGIRRHHRKEIYALFNQNEAWKFNQREK